MAKKTKSAAAVELGRKGGLARARNLSKEQLSKIGRAAVKARWAKFEKKGERA